MSESSPNGLALANAEPAAVAERAPVLIVHVGDCRIGGGDGVADVADVRPFDVDETAAADAVSVDDVDVDITFKCEGA